MSYRDKLLALSKSIGARPVPLEVTYKEEGVEKTETFLFKRMTGAEVDSIQLHSLRADGKGVDPKKLAGHSGRVIAACLVEDDGAPFIKADEVNAMPQSLREALFKAAATLNDLLPKRKEEEDDLGE